MYKKEELVAIVEQLIKEDYLMLGDTLYNYENNSITFKKSREDIIKDVITSGKGEIFAVKEIDGITYDASYQVMEILSIYDKDQMNLLFGKDFNEDNLSIKKLNFNPSHWFLLKWRDDWG